MSPPSLVCAVALIDELVAAGLRHVVVAPGSRSAPLALAAHARGDITLHVRIDERSASFLAVGLARATGRAAAVITTSGTATAHLHPAVLECDHGHVPLIVLTADRPPELRGIGANQTIDQPGLYGGAVRAEVELPTPDSDADIAEWRRGAERAWQVAHSGPHGPVHLNCPFREPLVGTVPAPDPPAHSATTAVEAPQVPTAADLAALATLASRRGVMVLGDGAATSSDAAAGLAAFARAAGWPIVAEPTSGLTGPELLGAGEHLLGVTAFTDAHRPEVVVSAGRLTLSRRTAALCRAAETHIHVDPLGSGIDPTRTVARTLVAEPGALAAAAVAEVDGCAPRWAAAWQQADGAVRAALDAVLDATEAPSEARTARDVTRRLRRRDALVVAASRPVRDVAAHGRVADGVRVISNRGVAGIDGFASTASGVALAHDGPVTALAGDLSWLHDSNGLIRGPLEAAPDLVAVVVNNDGGGIFGLIEPGGLAPEVVERVFATPHGVDLAALCAATQTPHRRISLADELDGAVAEARRTGGVAVVEVPCRRADTIALHARLDDVATHALT